MKQKIKIWIEDNNRNIIFGEGKVRLLEAIEELGSISKASKKLKMDYKKAWRHIEIVENSIKEEIVIRKKGGANGGGTQLTDKGRELIRQFREFRARIYQVSDEIFEEVFMKNGEFIIKTKD